VFNFTEKQLRRQRDRECRAKARNRAVAEIGDKL